MTVMWRKSSHSGGTSEQLECVEIADLPTGLIGIRDSKNPNGPHLAIPAATFGHLLRHIKDQ
jgi:Domain of unknown function (DUF397)